MKICQKYNIQSNSLDYWGGALHDYKEKATTFTSSVNRSRGSCVSSHWPVKVLATWVKIVIIALLRVDHGIKE